MREVEEQTMRGAQAARLGWAALAPVGLALLLFAWPALAERAPGNAPKTAASDKAAAGSVKPRSTASDNVAAIRDAITRTIASYGNDVQDAYHRELLKNREIGGDITVAFTVRPDGDVVDVRAEQSSLNWPPLEQEILKRVKAWKFPAFAGEPVQATAPYKFGPR